MTYKLLFIITILTFTFSSCIQCGREANSLDVPDEVVNKGALDVPDETMQNIVENIASPVEIAAMIKTLGVPFSKEYLASTGFQDSYNTSISKAFALGVFCADLGYLNMYSKTGSAIDYISMIRDLSSDLQLGQFFDFNTMKRLATNNTDLDSLTYISVHSFNQMDKYLRENKRGNLSALIIAGVWIEGLYLATQVAKNKPQQKLAEKIGEQKIILNDLMLLMRNYSSDPLFNKFVLDFEMIKNLFNDINITYEVGEPQTVEKNGMLTIVQTDKQVVLINDTQLKTITLGIEKVRNKLIK